VDNKIENLRLKIYDLVKILKLEIENELIFDEHKTFDYTLLYKPERLLPKEGCSYIDEQGNNVKITSFKNDFFIGNNKCLYNNSGECFLSSKKMNESFALIYRISSDLKTLM